MNRKHIFLLIFLFLGLSFSSTAQTSCPPNIDFELGTTAYWNYYLGTCCNSSGAMVGWASSAATPGRHDIMSGTGSDPYGFFPVVPYGAGSYTLRLGHDTALYCAEMARYYIHVPAGSSAYSLIYRYAVVLENPPSHSATEQPRFTVSAYDSATGNAIPCAQYNYVSSSSLPGFFLSPLSSSGNNIYCKSWTTASINLSGLGGTTVGIDFAAGDCALGGHWGYGYIDMSCGLFAIATIGCDSIHVTLSAPPGFHTYAWYDSSAWGTVIDTFQTITTGMPSRPTTYAVIMLPYTGFGCPDTLYTHVIPSKLAIHKSNDTSICFGGTTAISLTTGATDIALPLTYAWSPAATLSCTSCANPVASPTTTTTYYFTVTNAVGCSYSDSIRIVGSVVSASISSTNASCYGDTDGTATAYITAGTAPFTYSWSTTPVQTTVMASGLGAGSYTLRITDTTGCVGVASVIITAPPANVLTVVSTTNPTTCGGNDGTITLSGFAPGSTDTITYNDTSATGAILSHTIVLTASGSGAVVITGLHEGDYFNFAVVTHGCPFNVVTNHSHLTDPPKPATPTTTPIFYCQYEVATPLTVTGTTGSLLWYTGSSTVGATTAPTPVTTSPGTFTYTVTQTVAGCVSDPGSLTVTVAPKPSIPIVADTTYCQYATVPALTALGTNLQWYTTPTGGTGTTVAPTPSTTTVGSTTWYVTQRIAGCESDRSPISVNILYLPDFSIAESRNYLCQHDTLTFHYSGPSLVGAVYAWTLPTGTTILGGTVTDSTIIVKFDSLNFQSVFLTAANYGGRCFTTDTLKINVVPQPTAIPYVKENICAGDTVTLALISRASNADHFTWDFDGGTIITENSNSGGPYSMTWFTSGIHVIKVRSITVEGCEGKDVLDTIKVIARPDARIFTYSATGICLEDSLYLSAIDSTEYGNSYEWQPEHFFHNTNRPTIWGRIETPGYVSLHVTNAFGCTASDSVLITPDACCTVSFPSGFTPNGDGRNDVFRPLFEGYHRFHDFRITNRWGQTVFESTSNTCQWDGTFNGVPQDMGVYFYFIKFDCGGKTYTAKGDLTLIR